MDYLKIIQLVKSTKQFVESDKLKNKIQMKGYADFVTDVDYAISSYLKRQLSEIEPSIGFVSEEDSDNNPNGCQRFILDPIDGTTNLVFDYRMSSVSLGLFENGEITFGVVYNPYSDELFTAEKGKGAYLNGQKIHVVDRAYKDGIVEFGAGSTRKNEADEAFEIGKTVFKDCLDLRRMCSSALAICYIAVGRLNGYFEKKLKPWDYAAASLILRESGGELCDYFGNPLQFETPSSIIAGSPKMFGYLKTTIQKLYK